jgi:hypothetical protein
MKFNYGYFIPEVGDLVVDGSDGAHGVVVKVGPWRTFAYFMEQGAVKTLVFQVTLPEYGNITEQYSLKCLVKDGLEVVESGFRFICRDDVELLSTIF